MKCFCKICGYEWESRDNRKNIKRNTILPIRCSKCHSPLWNIGYNHSCEICNRKFLNPCIHHVDGNHNNNEDKNRIIICRDCHCAIHFGIGNGLKRKRKIRGYKDKNIIIKIKEYSNKLYCEKSSKKMLKQIKNEVDPIGTRSRVK